jgi:hypothetical protein
MFVVVVVVAAAVAEDEDIFLKGALNHLYEDEGLSLKKWIDK